ncbi:MAG: efflux RND transporter periplasmic adaptor subunit [Balneolaceae bacterium]
MKKTITVIIVVFIFGLLAYPKVKPLFSNTGDEAAGGPGSGSLMQVEAVTVQPESIQDRIFATGTIRADEAVDLSAEASGIVTGIYFREGSDVDRGELLLKINDSELQAEKNRTEFRLALAVQREERQKRLLERGGISQDDYDAILNEVNVLRSELELIQARIEQTEIRAPFSGKIGLKFVSEGSYISPNSRIATLQKIDPVKIDFSVPERYIARVNNGDELEYTVQGFDRSFYGEVYAIEPLIEQQTRTLQLRAISDNPEGQLFPGAFANITLILDTIEDALMIPTMSVIPELNSQKVFVVRDGVVDEVRIRTGIRTSNKVQVIDGIAPGDVVLTTGLLQVRPGMEVNIVENRPTPDV